jgi:hypothetical protein
MCGRQRVASPKARRKTLFSFRVLGVFEAGALVVYSAYAGASAAATAAYDTAGAGLYSLIRDRVRELSIKVGGVGSARTWTL